MSKTIEISVYDLQELRNENKMLHEEQGRLHRLWSKDTKHIAELEEENKKLKSDLAFERTMLDNVRAEYESSQEVIKKLKEQLKWWKDLVHKAKEFEYDEDGMDYIWQNTKI